MKACLMHCVSYLILQDLLDRDSEPGDVMECLIRHKPDNAMDEKCAAGIEHHQLVGNMPYLFKLLNIVNHLWGSFFSSC